MYLPFTTLKFILIEDMSIILDYYRCWWPGIKASAAIVLTQLSLNCPVSIMIYNNLGFLDDISSVCAVIGNPTMIHRADFRFLPSQWETALLCNAVPHWLGASLESALILGLRPANEGRRYFVTTSLIGWAQAKNQRWYTLVFQSANRHARHVILRQAENPLHNHWYVPWWRYKMETLSPLLALGEGNPPVTGGFP